MTPYIESSSKEISWLDQPLFAKWDWEKTAYIVLVVLAFISRFWDVGARAMSHDESLHTYFSYNLVMGKGFQHTPLMHGPLLFHLTALSYFLFGADDFTSRIPYAVFGVILVWMPYLFRHWLGRTGALVAAFLLLISPSTLYYARYIRQEGTIVVWTMLTILTIWRYMESRNPAWLFGLSAVLALHGADKSTSFFNVAMMVAFLAVLMGAHLLQSRNSLVPAITFAGAMGALMVVMCILFELISGLLVRAFTPNLNISGDGVVTLNAGTYMLMFSMLVLCALAALFTRWFVNVNFGAFMRRASQNSPAFNPIIVMVTTTLFMAAPALLLLLNPVWRVVSGKNLVELELLGNMSNLNNNMSVVGPMLALSMALIGIAIGLGLAWNWRRWLQMIGIFIAITLPLFTTLFTNPAGVATGYVGQLGYWMAQQGVMRGSQPIYYYFVVVPLYEYLPIFGTLCAWLLLAWQVFRKRIVPKLAVDEGEQSHISPSGLPRKRTMPTAPKYVRTVKVGPLELTIESNANTREIEDVKDNKPSSMVDQGGRLLDSGLIFPLMVTFWIVMTWATYTAAGEKMPWLTIHIALPMIVMTGWFVNQVTAKMTHWRELLTSQKWWFVCLSVMGVLLGVRVLSLIFGLPNESAKVVGQLGQAFLSLLLLIAVVYAAVRLFGKLPFFANGVLLAFMALLSVLTIRTAYTVAFINYDYTKEFLFYAHGGNTVKTALDQIRELSMRLNGGNTIRVGYDSDAAWPMSWYMREFPNARFLGGDLPPDFKEMDAMLIGAHNPKANDFVNQLATDYTRFDYMLVWWPMEDYKDLKLSNITDNIGKAKWRAAIWDIVFYRDYKKYAELYNIQSLTPENWSPGHKMYLFVRNDVGQRIWDYRVGAVAAGSGNAPLQPAPVVVRNKTYTGVTLMQNGERIVTDARGHRVLRIDASGDIKASWGGLGNQAGKFNTPWSVLVDAKQNIFVADTFNHRVQKFDKDGNVLATWGNPGVSNAEGQGKQTTFFGPRDLAIDKNGRLLVTDTGNKRVQVFDTEGTFFAQFGKGGAGDGEFNEPVGLEVDDAGNIYVVDTWNKRIQVFDQNYRYVRQIPVEVWQNMNQSELQNIDHKPYIARKGNNLYVSSPKTKQILALDSVSGKQLDLPNVAFQGNALPTGVLVAGNRLIVTDAAGGGVVEFELGN
jgi:uncharacterized protein (TIGR03663 family)